MNKVIDRIIKYLKDIFTSKKSKNISYVEKTYREDVTELGKAIKESSKVIEEVNNQPKVVKDDWEPPEVTEEVVKKDWEPREVTEGIWKPKPFKKFKDFGEKSFTPENLNVANRLIEEESRRRAKVEKLYEYNGKGELKLGEDDITREGYYMSKDKLNHIKKVMYHKKRK